MNPDTGNLEVEFANGSIYHYPNVPIKTVNEFITAPSPGKFFHAKIKAFGGKKA